ncbi:hypothetical protein SASPL_100094 [Salvia splendens]|uniref:Uncharacterized protein n=1 Tax=Salvia splendens TaxID=180675 RepID=A0A8X9ACX4_SALSN|nr:hypothetical protein SASPL_100094 [Salvia splendens]
MFSLASWKNGTDCCQLFGITCLTGRRVTALSLLGRPGNLTTSLSGKISPSLSKLKFLDSIYLQDLKNLTGPKPFLRPDSELPRQSRPAISAQTPRNQLSGPIPDIFPGLTSLISLSFSHNKLTGKIRNSLAILAPKLRFLELGHNSLSGAIPGYLGKFQALDTQDLSWNNFTGTVPKSFANLTKIFNLDLSYNRLTDPFPVMNVKGIESLDSSHNLFNLGSIPKWVISSPIIYSMKLAKCGLKIKLDDFRPVQTYFYDYIDLSENEITGSPVQLLNRTDYLVGFYASGNKLKFDLGSLRFSKTLK